MSGRLIGGPGPFLGALKYSSSDFAHNTPRSGIVLADWPSPAGSAAAGALSAASTIEAKIAGMISARHWEQCIANSSRSCAAAAASAPPLSRKPYSTRGHAVQLGAGPRAWRAGYVVAVPRTQI